MLTTQSEFIEIGKEHFLSVILPELIKISKEAVDAMMVFIEGSAAYGFCDSFSDVDIDYYINMPLEEDVMNRIRTVFTADTFYHKSNRVSYGFSGRYWKFDELIKTDTGSFWAESNPYALYNIQHAVPVWDPSSLLAGFKAKTAFYPSDIYKKHVRGLWLTMCDSGEYNLSESLKRSKTTEGMIYFGRALEASLRLIYLLNREYYPPAKWLTSGLQKLEHNFGISGILNEIHDAKSPDENYQCFMKVFGSIKEFLLTEHIIEKECVENYSSIFQKPFTIFNTF